jgi:hypothetical protein
MGKHPECIGAENGITAVVPEVTAVHKIGALSGIGLKITPGPIFITII